MDANVLVDDSTSNTANSWAFSIYALLVRNAELLDEANTDELSQAFRKDVLHTLGLLSFCIKDSIMYCHTVLGRRLAIDPIAKTCNDETSLVLNDYEAKKYTGLTTPAAIVRKRPSVVGNTPKRTSKKNTAVNNVSMRLLA